MFALIKQAHERPKTPTSQVKKNISELIKFNSCTQLDLSNCLDSNEGIVNPGSIWSSTDFDTWPKTCISKFSQEKEVGYPICTGSKSHFKQDPNDCHSFYQCDKDSNFDTFHVYKFECEEGLAYDIQSEACMLETFVNRCWQMTV